MASKEDLDEWIKHYQLGVRTSTSVGGREHCQIHLEFLEELKELRKLLEIGEEE